MKKIICDVVNYFNDISITALKNNELFKKSCLGDYDLILRDKNGAFTNILIIKGLNEECLRTIY